MKVSVLMVFVHQLVKLAAHLPTGELEVDKLVHLFDTCDRFRVVLIHKVSLNNDKKTFAIT